MGCGPVNIPLPALGIRASTPNAQFVAAVSPPGARLGGPRPRSLRGAEQAALQLVISALLKPADCLYVMEAERLLWTILENNPNESEVNARLARLGTN